MDPNIIGMIVFAVLLGIFLFWKKKEIALEKIAFPVLYLIMYRTKFGLKAMDFIGTRFRRLVMFLGVVGIIVGFLGMILIVYVLIYSFIQIFTVPNAPASVMPVLPFQAKGVYYVPFFYWIISIFIIAGVHEMAHGIVARAHNMKIKSSGFAFLAILIPIIPAAFVEPDEKNLQKKPKKQQLAVFAAGPLSNIILTVIIALMFIFAFNPITSKVLENKGVTISSYALVNSSAEKAGLPIGSTIIALDSKSIKTSEDLASALNSKKPGDKVKVKTEDKEYSLTLGKNPQDLNKPYLGVTLAQKTAIKESILSSYGTFWPNTYLSFLELMKFIALLSLGIGLFNLAPIGPVDGGRMFHTALMYKIEKQKADKIFGYVSIFLLVIIVASLVFNFFR